MFYRRDVLYLCQIYDEERYLVRTFSKLEEEPDILTGDETRVVQNAKVFMEST
jgi:hypothetical protein